MDNFVPMDYKQLQKRVNRRRFALLSAGAIVAMLVTLIFVSTFLETSPPGKIKSEMQSGATQNPNSWMEILQMLDNGRAKAISQRDSSQLDQIFADHSQLKISDSTLIAELIAKQMQIIGLSFEIEDVKLISHRWSNDEEVVELKVVDTRSSYLIQSEDGELRMPEREAQTWIISLHKIGQEWRIGNAEGDLDNR